jgi:hypothetical protein
MVICIGVLELKGGVNHQGPSGAAQPLQKPQERKCLWGELGRSRWSPPLFLWRTCLEYVKLVQRKTTDTLHFVPIIKRSIFFCKKRKRVAVRYMDELKSYHVLGELKCTQIFRDWPKTPGFNISWNAKSQPTPIQAEVNPIWILLLETSLI